MKNKDMNSFSLNEERKEEINFTINFIQKLCETLGIGLISKDNRVVVIDSFSGDTYNIFKKRD